jgi:hypothetical protein
VGETQKWLRSVAAEVLEHLCETPLLRFSRIQNLSKERSVKNALKFATLVTTILKIPTSVMSAYV